MTATVLDASALIALLLCEPGHAVVERIVEDAAVCAVNLGEVVGHFARRGIAEADIRTMVAALPVTIHDFTREDAYFAGLMLPMTRSLGLSLGDRACLALARRLRVPAVTGDRAWSAIATSIGVEVVVIR